MHRYVRNLVLALCAALPLAASAEQWGLATAYPDNNFHTENVRWFAEQVDKATDGKLKITVHAGASMFKMDQLKRALRTGQVPMAEFFLSAYGNEDPILEADSVPFLAVTRDEVVKLAEAQKPMIEARFAKQGLVPLYSVPWPGQGLYTKQPVDTLASFKGMKLRGQTPIVARMGELMGAVPVNVQFVEVPQAFQTDVVTAMLTAATTGVDTQAWEYTKYFYDVSAFRPRNIVAVNARAWKALPEPVRQKVLDVARQAEARGWEKSDALQTEALKTLAGHGMTVVQPSDALKAELSKVGDQMIAEWVQRAGDDGRKLARAMGKN